MYELWDDPRSTNPWARLIVPAVLRGPLLRAAHGAAHLSADKMSSALMRFYYWPGFLRQINNLCKSCQTCQERRGSRQASGPLGVAPVATRPGEVVSVDLLTLPATSRGSEYLLLAIDHASRYVVGSALKDRSSATVAKALRRELFENPLLGAPAVLLSDNGSEFKGATTELSYDE